MWRKVTLTGVVSVLGPGSMTQIAITIGISVCFLTMHARHYPYEARPAPKPASRSLQRALLNATGQVQVTR